jgi:hypothetical protein
MGRNRRWAASSRAFLGRSLAVVLLLGCGGGGGGSGGGGPAGLPRTASVPSLDATQIAALCDWINASVGGYGSIDNCDGGGSRHADSTQQSCISGFSGAQACPTLTVGAVQDCIKPSAGICAGPTRPPRAPASTSVPPPTAA